MTDVLHVDCPACGKSIKAPARLAGRTGKCPSCGAAVTMPSLADAEPEAMALAEGEAEPQAAAPPPLPGGGRPRRAKRSEPAERPKRGSYNPPERLGPALGVAAIAALVLGLAWAAMIHYGEMEFPPLAVIVGIGIAFPAWKLRGRGELVAIGVASLTVLAVLLGQYLAFSSKVADQDARLDRIEEAQRRYAERMVERELESSYSRKVFDQRRALLLLWQERGKPRDYDEVRKLVFETGQFRWQRWQFVDDEIVEDLLYHESQWERDFTDADGYAAWREDGERRVRAEVGDGRPSWMPSVSGSRVSTAEVMGAWFGINHLVYCLAGGLIAFSIIWAATQSDRKRLRAEIREARGMDP